MCIYQGISGSLGRLVWERGGAATGAGNISWSDRSATSHTISTTDWTNGYLLKNFTSNATSYSK